MQTTKPDQLDRPDPLRRRLARGGLAGTVVLGSLISKPVLGAVPYNCTRSGKLSGNTSSHGTPVACNTLGFSPGYWKTHPSEWPLPLLAGGASGTNTLFNGFRPGNAALADAFWLNTAKEVVSTSSSTKATMMQVLKTGGGLNDTVIFALGRATVASILNSFAFLGSYPLSANDVILMFNAVYSGGKFQVNATTQWDRDQVKTYFESLYGAKG